MWQMRKNCSLFITSGTLSQLTGNTSICNTSKIDFRRLEALFCGVWPSPDFSLLSSRISLQNRKKCRFEPTFKKACPARLSERKSLISSGFRWVRGLQKRPQNGHPCHSCIKDSKCSCPQGHVGSNPTASAIKALKTLCFRGFFFCSGSIYFGENNSNGALGAPLCGAQLILHHTHYTRKMYKAMTFSLISSCIYHPPFAVLCAAPLLGAKNGRPLPAPPRLNPHQ